MFIFNQQLMIISLPLQNTYCYLNHVVSLYLTEPYSHFHILKIMFSICSIMFWQAQTNFIWLEIGGLILHKQHIMLCDLGDFLKVILCSVCCSSVTLIPLWSLRFILGPAPTLGTTAPQYRDTLSIKCCLWLRRKSAIQVWPLLIRKGITACSHLITEGQPSHETTKCKKKLSIWEQMSLWLTNSCFLKKNVVHALLHYAFEQNSGVYFKYCTYFADLCNTLILCQTEGFWEV